MPGWQRCIHGPRLVNKHRVTQRHLLLLLLLLPPYTRIKTDQLVTAPIHAPHKRAPLAPQKTPRPYASSLHKPPPRVFTAVPVYRAFHPIQPDGIIITLTKPQHATHRTCGPESTKHKFKSLTGDTLSCARLARAWCFVTPTNATRKQDNNNKPLTGTYIGAHASETRTGAVTGVSTTNQSPVRRCRATPPAATMFPAESATRHHAHDDARTFGKPGVDARGRGGGVYIL